jgi:hypothetical protein
MPVKVIELVLRHQIDEFFDEVDRLKMTGDIEMHPAIKSRFPQSA